MANVDKDLAKQSEEMALDLQKKSGEKGELNAQTGLAGGCRALDLQIQLLLSIWKNSKADADGTKGSEKPHGFWGKEKNIKKIKNNSSNRIQDEPPGPRHEPQKGKNRGAA